MKVQQKLKAPKNQFNSFGKYAYRSCEDILEAVKPILAEVGAVILVSDSVHSEGLDKTPTQAGINEQPRNYLVATAKFICTETGQAIDCKGMAREEQNKKGMDSAQLTGATSSYARKYALNGLLLIDDAKDADSTNQHGKGAPQQRQPQAPQQAGGGIGF